MEHKIIFPTLPLSANEGREIVAKEIHLSAPPAKVQESLSADIVRLDPPQNTDEKDADALRTMGEVVTMLDLPAHVIRFWETRFPQLSPSQREDGRRYYHPEDVRFLQGLSRLLHEEGYTIKGVHRLIRKKGASFVRAKSEEKIAEQDERTDQILHRLLGQLEQLQARVQKLAA